MMFNCLHQKNVFINQNVPLEKFRRSMIHLEGQNFKNGIFNRVQEVTYVKILQLQLT